MDILAGSLDTFSLESILRLIARAGQPGVLKIENERLTGRVFVAGSGIIHATTRELNGPRKTSGSERRARALSNDPALVGGDPDPDLEQVVEVIVRLLRDQQGDFTFLPGVTPSSSEVTDDRSYEVESVIGVALSHIEEWGRIEALVPDATARFQVAPELPADKFEITIDGRTWLFLSAIGQGASIEDLAEDLGIFEFPTAMQVAEMVKQGLLVSEEDNGAVDPADPADPERDVTVTTSFEPVAKAAPVPASPPREHSGSDGIADS